MNKNIRNNIIVIVSIIVFGLVSVDFVNEYIKIIINDYSIIKTIIEIFKISWWRVPILIFSLLTIFVR